MIKIKVDEGLDKFVKIKVIGIGGGGCNAVGRMATTLSGVDLIGINTDIQALANCDVPIKIQIGQRITGGMGSGGDPEKGKFAANEDKEQIGKLLKGVNICFLTAGLGGGTGTGASPVIARIAREQGAITVAVVTTPFAIEGPKRINYAEQGLIELKENVDTFIHIPNEKLFEITDTKTSIIDDFKKIDEILSQGVSSVVELITKPGVINLDFADVQSVMENGGESIMGVGKARGPERAVNAAKEAISNRLLEEKDISSARNILISITGGLDLTLHEVKDAVKTINNNLSSLSNSVLGVVTDEKSEDEVKITVIATGLSEKKEFPPPQQKRVHPRRGKKEPTLFDDAEASVIEGVDYDKPTFIRKRENQRKREED